MSAKDILLGLIIIVVWGFNFVVIVWGLDGMPPLLMGGMRFLLAAAIGSLFIARPNVPWRWLLAYSLTLGFGQFACLFTAIHVGMPAGLASIVVQSQGLFTLLLAHFLLRERAKPYQWLALVIAAIGLTLIGFSQSDTNMTIMGFVLTLSASACWSLGNIVNRSISQRGYRADVSLVIWSAWIPPIPFFISSFWFEGKDAIQTSLMSMDWSAVGSLLYLSVVASIVGYGLWGYLLSRYSPTQVSPLTLGVPVTGLASTAWFLGERISDTQWVGGGLVLVSLVINVIGTRLFARRVINVYKP